MDGTVAGISLSFVAIQYSKKVSAIVLLNLFIRAISHVTYQTLNMFLSLSLFQGCYAQCSCHFRQLSLALCGPQESWRNPWRRKLVVNLLPLQLRDSSTS